MTKSGEEGELLTDVEIAAEIAAALESQRNSADRDEWYSFRRWAYHPPLVEESESEFYLRVHKRFFREELTVQAILVGRQVRASKAPRELVRAEVAKIYLKLRAGEGLDVGKEGCG